MKISQKELSLEASLDTARSEGEVEGRVKRATKRRWAAEDLRPSVQHWTPEEISILKKAVDNIVFPKKINKGVFETILKYPGVADLNRTEDQIMSKWYHLKSDKARNEKKKTEKSVPDFDQAFPLRC